METIGKRIEERRLSLGLTKTAVWKAAKRSSGAYTHWLNGGDLESDALFGVAGVLRVTVESLRTGKNWPEEIANEKSPNYPMVVGTARCGDHGYYLDLEGGDGHLEFEAEPGSIAIRIRGDSMHPAIRDGWYVVIEPSGQPTIGEYVLLKFKNGKNMVKELLQIKSDCYIVTSVSNGDRLTAMKEELFDIKAIGAVVPPSKHKEF